MPKSLTMTPKQWLAALADAWDLGHRDVCTDCCCPPDSNPYRLIPPAKPGDPA